VELNGITKGSVLNTQDDRHLMRSENPWVRLKNTLYGPALEQGLPISLFLSLGILTGLVSTNILAVIPSLLSDPEWTGANPYLIVLMANFNLATGLSLAIVLVLLGTYISRLEPAFLGAVSMMSVTNVLVYLCGVSVVFPAVPVRLGALLLMFLMLNPRTTNRKISQGFQIFLFAFIVMNLIGLCITSFGIDQVRAGIPILIQLSGTLPYVVAIIIYFVIKRNGWRLHNFERFFKIVMIGGLFFAMESLATFYLGRSTLPFLSGFAVDDNDGMFQSTLLQSQHLVSRIGLATLFVAIYFYYRTWRHRYILAAVLGGLLVFSTLNRQVIVSCLLGIGLLWTVSRNGARRVPWNRPIHLVGAVIVLGLALIAGQVLVQGITETRVANSVERTVRNRLLHVARAVDVLWFTSFVGTGPGSDQIYRGSFFVPTTIAFEPVMEFFQEDPDYAFSRFRRPGLEDQKAYTVHNLWVRFLLEWGVVGLIFLICVVRQAWKLFRKLYSVHGIDTRAAWAIFSFAIALSLSMMTTVKLDLYWYFVVVFMFVGQGVKELVEERLAQNQLQTPDPRPAQSMVR